LRPDWGLAGRDVHSSIAREASDGPIAAKRLVAAYEKTLRGLGIQDRRDPIAEMVAKKVFEIGRSGIEDPSQICKLAIKALRVI
jgi:hypothetical protein